MSEQQPTTESLPPQPVAETRYANPAETAAAQARGDVLEGEVVSEEPVAGAESTPYFTPSQESDLTPASAEQIAEDARQARIAAMGGLMGNVFGIREPRDALQDAVNSVVDKGVRRLAERLNSTDPAEREHARHTFDRLAATATEPVVDVDLQSKNKREVPIAPSEAANSETDAEAEVDTFSKRLIYGKEMKTAMEDVLSNVDGDVADKIREELGLPKAPEAADDEAVSDLTPEESIVVATALGEGIRSVKHAAESGKLVQPSEVISSVRDTVEPLLMVGPSESPWTEYTGVDSEAPLLMVGSHDADTQEYAGINVQNIQEPLRNVGDSRPYQYETASAGAKAEQARQMFIPGLPGSVAQREKIIANAFAKLPERLLDAYTSEAAHRLLQDAINEQVAELHKTAVA